jgi:hypothetical protein
MIVGAAPTSTSIAAAGRSIRQPHVEYEDTGTEHARQREPVRRQPRH